MHARVTPTHDRRTEASALRACRHIGTYIFSYSYKNIFALGTPGASSAGRDDTHLHGEFETRSKAILALLDGILRSIHGSFFRRKMWLTGFQ